MTSFGGRWLATWQRNFSHDDINSNLHGNFIGQDGIAGSEFTYGFFGGAPVVAASADTALLVWRTNSERSNANNILARLIDLNGTLDPATLTISAAPTREFAPSVSWNGTHFVIAWTDKRNELIYFDQRSETYAARVDLSGNLLDGNGFSVGDRSLSSIHPSIASLNGTTVIGASMFRNEPTLQSYRVGIERYGVSGTDWPVALLDAVPNQGDIPLPVDFNTIASFDLN